MPTPVAPPGSEQRPARQPVNVARWISLLCLAGAALVLAYLAFGYPPRAAVYDGQNAVFATGEVTAVWPLIKGRRGFLQTYAALVYYTDAEGRLRRVAAPYRAAQGERLALGQKVWVRCLASDPGYAIVAGSDDDYLPNPLQLGGLAAGLLFLGRALQGRRRSDARGG